MKIVGIQRVVSTTKAGEETSQAVYPRASNVLRIPPLGKEEASGSCWISSFKKMQEYLPKEAYKAVTDAIEKGTPISREIA